MLGVVLAAGAGKRFEASGGDGPKQLAVVDGQTLVERAVAAATDAGLDEVVVIAGAVDLSAAGLPVVVLDNERWAEGMATSVQVGIAHARAAGHDAIVVGLADQPGVTTDAWRAVAAPAIAARAEPFLLVGIDRHHGWPRLLKGLGPAVDGRAWRLPLRVGAPRECLPGGLEPVAQVMEPSGDGPRPHRMPLGLQCRGERGRTLAGPPQQGHRVPTGHGIDPGFQGRHEGRIMPPQGRTAPSRTTLPLRGSPRARRRARPGEFLHACPAGDP